MPWKMNDDGQHEFDSNSNPIWVHEDGKEVGWNVPGQLARQSELVNTVKALKEERNEFKEKVSAFGDILDDNDAEKLREALAIAADVEAGNMVASGKKDEAIKKAVESVTSEYNGKLSAITQQFEDARNVSESQENEISEILVGQIFDRSAYLKDKTKLPSDIANMLFRNNFKVEKVDGRRVAVPYLDGEKLFSAIPERAGKIATPEEAIERLFNLYPNRDQFLADLPGGPGVSGGVSAPNGGRDIVLSGADAKNPKLYQAAKEKVASTGGKVVLKE